MLSTELFFEISETISPVDAKPGIPREAPIRREEPEIPNPTVPIVPKEEPVRIPVPQEPVRIPVPQG